MIALPFIYFGIWSIMSWKKRGLDIATYILLIYTVTSFFAIVIDVGNFYDVRTCKNLGLGIIAPILYCLLLTLCISPFYKCRFKLSSPFKPIKNTKWFTTIVYGYFIIFLIVFTVSFTRINEVLVSNLAEVRNEQYIGETESFYNHLSGMPRYICAMCQILSPSSYIMILFFFYSLSFLNKSKLFNAITIISSATPLLISINIADRSQFFYWVLCLLFCYILFRNHIQQGNKGFIKIVLICLLSLILTYFFMITTSRFSERETGTSGGIILYAGQSYINFCNFINYLRHDYHSLCVIFPFTNQFILDGDGYFAICSKVEMATNMQISVFSTFLGLIYSITGFIPMLLYVFVYRFIAIIFLGKYSSDNVITMNRLIKIFIVALVPVLGLFGHFYMGSSATVALVVWLIMGKIIK